MGKSKIIFDAERMKYRNVGLYHFCLNLGNKLLDLEKERLDLNLRIYTNSDCEIFHKTATYKNVRGFHKYFHPFLGKSSVWHGAHQLTEYLPKSTQIRKVLTIHDLNFLREKEEFKQRKYLRRIQANIDKSDVLVCISNFVKKELLDSCDVRNQDLHVIYNGDNVKDDLPATIPIRKSLDLSKPYLFSIGAILRKKNFHTLPYLLVGNNNNLVIAGPILDQEYLNEVLAISKKLGVENRLFFVGEVTEQEKYYLMANCLLFCFPSITEGFGLPVVEAMHFGCSIMLSRYTSLPEIGGDVVKYFDSFDTEYLMSLGRKIETFALSSVEKVRVLNRARMFSWENAAKSYWDIYKGII